MPIYIQSVYTDLHTCVKQIHSCMSSSSPDDALSGSGDAALLMLSPSSGDQFCSHSLWTRRTHFLPFPGCVVVLVPYFTHMATRLWECVQQYSRAGEYMQ